MPAIHEDSETALRALADALDVGIRDGTFGGQFPYFDMANWVRNGTREVTMTVCAIGHGARTGVLPPGLGFGPDNLAPQFPIADGRSLAADGTGLYGSEAVAAGYGIPVVDARFLFLPGSYNDGELVTPTAVAARIRGYLAGEFADHPWPPPT